jgi:hypothetical protein
MKMKAKMPVISCALAVYGAVVLAAVVAPSGADAQTPTEAIADCIGDAWDSNDECQTNDTWWDDLPCAIKFEADVLLCAGAVF